MAQKMFSDHANSGMIEVSGFSCSGIRLLHVAYVRAQLHLRPRTGEDYENSLKFQFIFWALW